MQGDNGKITYALEGDPDQESGSFSIDPDTGALKVSKELDREKQSTFELIVIASDGGNPMRKTRRYVQVEILVFSTYSLIWL